MSSSDAGTGWQRYGQSKLADILLAKALAKRCLEITSVSVHPSLVKTGLATATEPSMMTLIIKLTKWMPMYQTPEKGAYNTLWAATAPKANLENGSYYEPVGKKAGRPTGYSGVTEICSDEELADRLWQWTERELEGRLGYSFLLFKAFHRYDKSPRLHV